MKAEILDQTEELTSTCYLTRIMLKDFVTSLPQGYKEYEVQREIVTNTYLDNLIDTVLNKKHIPTIVLVVDEGDYSKEEQHLTISKFKILDGLQRTYRLKLIWDSIKFFKSELKVSNEILTLKRLSLSRKYSSQLSEINSNSKILESIIRFYNSKKELGKVDFDMESAFNTYQWFEVWSGLTAPDEVNKMLILNAGHKPVKTQHQLELLFLNIIPIIKKTGFNDFQLVREKDSNSTTFSKNRKFGQFHFSHLITSILSLHAGAPVTANVNLVHKTQSAEFEIDDLSNYFNYEFLHGFIDSLLDLDNALKQKYDDYGTRWLGREVSLIGLFAALGKFGKERNSSPTVLLQKLRTAVIDHPEVLNLDKFEEARNSLDLSKINIGTVNKRAIFDGLFTIFTEQSNLINWKINFRLASE